jgi:hypothetical protein
MASEIKSDLATRNLTWPGIVAVALLGMLVFMIFADPAAEQPTISSAHTTK